MNEQITLTALETDRIIEMAWEDRTSFDAIKYQFGCSEQQVIALMRKEMKLSSFKLWRERVQGRITKHEKNNGHNTFRFKCSRQKQISFNKISKRA
ncbi:MAG: TIGR03643 family protein [Bacteroidota bacterium]